MTRFQICLFIAALQAGCGHQPAQPGSRLSDLATTSAASRPTAPIELQSRVLRHRMLMDGSRVFYHNQTTVRPVFSLASVGPHLGAPQLHLAVWEDGVMVLRQGDEHRWFQLDDAVVEDLKADLVEILQESDRPQSLGYISPDLPFEELLVHVDGKSFAMCDYQWNDIVHSYDSEAPVGGRRELLDLEPDERLFKNLWAELVTRVQRETFRLPEEESGWWWRWGD